LKDGTFFGSHVQRSVRKYDNNLRLVPIDGE
jgi:hypothetical protein